MRPQRCNRKVALPCSERVSQYTNERRRSYDKRRLLCGSRVEGMEGTTRPGGQAFWRTLVRGGPTGNSAGQKQAALLVGTSHGDARRDAAAVGARRSVSSRVRCRLRLWLAYNPELPDPNFAKMIYSDRRCETKR